MSKQSLRNKIKIKIINTKTKIKAAVCTVEFRHYVVIRIVVN